MSLEFGKKGENILANLYENSKLKNVISYIDEEKIPEGQEKLTQIRLNAENETFFPYINDFNTTKQTQRIYVCGESGVGKTTFLLKYLTEFHKKYPKSKILFFSSKMEDENIDKLNYVERVQIDEDILTNPYTLAEIAETKPCLTIFDDIEDFQTKKITKEIDRLLNEILRNGRSYGIYCIYTHHQPSDYKATRNLIFEATHCVIFPKRAGKDAYNYFLESKMNLRKKLVEKINGLKSNFVCIKKNIPKCIIADKYIILV